MPLTRLILVLLILSLGLSPIPATAAPGPSAKDLEFFEKRVRPLLIRRCHKCHSDKSKPIAGGLKLDRSAAIRQGGDSGAAIAPGRPNASLLIEAVRYTNADLQMPPKSKLPASEIAILVEWVRRGAALPKDRPLDKPRPTRDLKTARNFWSFQPLKPVVLPRTPRADSWARTRTDHFVHARQEQHRLVPSGEADRRVLVRRLSFDLLGLPPTSGQVDRFVADTRPDAYERLVDTFLANPH
ncbi:MAG: DUF1549 domain-containing protein, partial [Planctomycetota bacterium]|nr:DUF1549 domain-containing protein [Planctomycetota bacterium]